MSAATSTSDKIRFLCPRLTYDTGESILFRPKTTSILAKENKLVIAAASMKTFRTSKQQLRTLRLYATMWTIVSFLSVGFLVSNAAVQHDVYWRDYVDGQIPRDAFPGANGLYIGQMPLNGILPGTIYPDKKLMVTECCTGKKTATQGLKILCSGHPENLKWEYISVPDVTVSNAVDFVRGGIEEGIVYIGKIFHEGEWKIGKVYPANHRLEGLRVWNSEGGDYITRDFQILKYVDGDRWTVISSNRK